jgi:glycosyltransferase involved in cell wall biosynthesis
METLPVTRKRSIRFLFLGDLETDRRVKNFIRYFAARGWYTELLCSTKKPVPADLREELNARIHILSRTSGPLMFLEHHRYLMAQLKQLPQLDVTFSCELYSLSAGRSAKSLAPAMHLTYDAREVYTGLPTVTGKPLRKWFWKHMERRGLAKTDSIIVTGPLDAGAIEKVHHFLPRSFLVRNMPMHVSKPERNTYLRDHFKIPPSKTLLIYVGGIQRDRGLGQMISAMNSLQNEAALVLIGDGELREGLQSVVKNDGLQQSVFFHEAIASEKVLSVLASADVGVVLIDTDAPSYALALPSKMYEYLFAGLPVLASPMKQAMMEFGHNPAVRFVKLHDEAAIIAGVRELSALTNDGALMSKLQDEALEAYSFEHDARLYCDFLEDRIA